eukprot:scaffold1138_cov217-Prasinococcus_capsulatus_cf.AAC.1
MLWRVQGAPSAHLHTCPSARAREAGRLRDEGATRARSAGGGNPAVSIARVWSALVWCAALGGGGMRSRGAAAPNP